MSQVLAALSRAFPDLQTSEAAVNCHHNDVTRERRLGKDVFVTRKGAVRAGASQSSGFPFELLSQRTSQRCIPDHD